LVSPRQRPSAANPRGLREMRALGLTLGGVTLALGTA
jgi:hypothetical protein